MAKGIQDHYPEDASHCYGCGRLNLQGYQIKSFWEGDKTIALFTPEEYHTAIPGFVYGGLLASLIDCHGTGSAALAASRKEKIDLGREKAPRFVTASLKVDYLKPTPLGPQLRLEGTITEQKERKVITKIELKADNVVCVKGEVIAVKMPENMIPK